MSAPERKRERIDEEITMLEAELPFISSFNEVIKKIVDHACHLLNAETAAILLYDQEKRKLIPQLPAFGISGEQALKEYQVSVDQDEQSHQAAYVFHSGKTIVLGGCQNPQYRALAEATHLKTMITAPLEVGGKRIGVLHVSNKRDGDFSAWDIQVIEVLSGHFAALIENSLYLQREKERIRELEVLKERLQATNKEISKSLEINRALTNLVLEGAGIEKIVKELSKLLGERPVVVTDTLGRLISSSEPVDEKSKGKVSVSRWLIVGKRTVGKLCILGPKETLCQLDMVAIDHAASSLALQMLQEAAEMETESRLRGSIIERLIRGGSEKEPVERAMKRLGLDPDCKRVIAVLEFLSSPEHLEDKLAYCQSSLPEVLASPLPDQRLIVLLPIKKGLDMIRLKPYLSEALTQVFWKLGSGERGIKARAGIGSVCREIKGYKDSFQQANLALAVPGEREESGEEKGDLKICFWADCGSLALLSVLSKEEIAKSFLEEKLGPLLASPNSQVLLHTLEVFLGNRGHYRKTAEDLHIHQSTLRYRLDCLEEILGGFVHEGGYKRWFDLHLALQLLDISRPQLAAGGNVLPEARGLPGDYFWG